MTFHAKRFGRAATTYGQYAEVQNKMANTLVELLPSPLPVSSPIVFEMGCGTGIFTQKLMSKIPKGKFTITDASEEMLRQTLKSLEFKSENHFQIFDASGENQIVENHFDLAASNALVQWFPNLIMHFKMVAAHLKNTGIYLASGFMSDNFPELNSLLALPPFGFQNFPGHNETEILAAARTAGFIVETWTTTSIDQIYPTPRDFLNAIKGLGSARKPDNAPMTRSKLEYLMKEYLVRYACDGGVKATWKPWYARLRKANSFSPEFGDSSYPSSQYHWT